MNRTYVLQTASGDIIGYTFCSKCAAGCLEDLEGDTIEVYWAQPKEACEMCGELLLHTVEQIIEAAKKIELWRILR